MEGEADLGQTNGVRVEWQDQMEANLGKIKPEMAKLMVHTYSKTRPEMEG